MGCLDSQAESTKLTFKVVEQRARGQKLRFLVSMG
jgi:hypothetical protein